MDFDSQLNVLEKEIKEEMAKSINKTEEKVKFLLTVLDNLQKEYPYSHEKELLKEDFKTIKKQAIKARNELIIHRECLGFTI